MAAQNCLTINYTLYHTRGIEKEKKTISLLLLFAIDGCRCWFLLAHGHQFSEYHGANKDQRRTDPMVNREWIVEIDDAEDQ